MTLAKGRFKSSCLVLVPGCASLVMVAAVTYAGPITFETNASFVTDAVTVSDLQSGPPPGTIESLVTTDEGTDTQIANPAQTKARSVGGAGSVAVDAVFDSARDGVHTMTASAHTSETVANATTGPQSYTYTFDVFGPKLQIDDFVNGPVATVNYDIELMLDGSLIWSSAATLAGNRNGYTLTETGTNLGATFYCLELPCNSASQGRIFGFQFSDVSTTLSLGSLPAGGSLTLETWLFTSVSALPYELGGFAGIGDPGDVNAVPGLVGSVAVGGATGAPEPDLLLLLAAGLAALARSRKPRTSLRPSRPHRKSPAPARRGHRKAKAFLSTV